MKENHKEINKIVDTDQPCYFADCDGRVTCEFKGAIKVWISGIVDSEIHRSRRNSLIGGINYLAVN